MTSSTTNPNYPFEKAEMMEDCPTIADAEISVSDAMIAAGIDEIQSHKIGADLGYIVECVFRAMAYVKVEASASSLHR